MKDAFLRIRSGTFASWTAQLIRRPGRADARAEPPQTPLHSNDQPDSASDASAVQEWDPASCAMLTRDQREAIDRALRDTSTIDPSPGLSPSPDRDRVALATAASHLPLGPIDARTLASILAATRG